MNTHRHGIVEGVVVDAGAQWIIEHAIFKQLQSFCHFFMEVICRFIRTCKVEIVWVQPVNKINGYFYHPWMWNYTIWVTMRTSVLLHYLVVLINTLLFLFLPLQMSHLPPSFMLPPLTQPPTPSQPQTCLRRPQTNNKWFFCCCYFYRHLRLWLIFTTVQNTTRLQNSYYSKDRPRKFYALSCSFLL